MKDMYPHTAIITGAGSGIGLHLAQTLAGEGYTIVLIDLQLSSVRERIAGNNHVLFKEMDVRDATEWESLRGEVSARYSRIDYLFNCAGIVQPGFVYNAPLSDIDRHIDINCKGTMYGTKVIGDFMKKQGSGHIINMASLAGITPVPGIALYSASKFAVRGFSLAASYEYAPFGVAISVVCPDVVKTPMYDLELTYEEETALVFSGSMKVLTVGDVVKEILKVMRTRKREVTLPSSRGRLAKLAGLWPALADALRGRLTRKGLKQKEILRRRDGA
jgi:3-oxoacyl-[acyl-carrier protein] reductase